MILRFRLRKGSERGRLRRERNLGRVEEVVDAVGEVARGAGEVAEPADSAGEDISRFVGVFGTLEFVGPGAPVGLESEGEDLDRRPIPRRGAKGIRRTRIRGRERRRAQKTDVAILGARARSLLLWIIF